MFAQVLFKSCRLIAVMIGGVSFSIILNSKVSVLYASTLIDIPPAKVVWLDRICRSLPHVSWIGNIYVGRSGREGILPYRR